MLLRAATLLQEVIVSGGILKLGESALIKAIRTFDWRDGKAIYRCIVPRGTFPVATRAQVEAKTDPVIEPYCAHPDLSLNRFGGHLLAVQADAHTRPMTPTRRWDLLQTMCCFFDFTKCRPKPGSRAMDAYERIIDVQNEFCEQRGELWWQCGEFLACPRAEGSSGKRKCAPIAE